LKNGEKKRAKENRKSQNNLVKSPRCPTVRGERGRGVCPWVLSPFSFISSRWKRKKKKERK